MRLTAESALGARRAFFPDEGNGNGTVSVSEERPPLSNPLCPTSTFFVVHQTMAHSDHVVPFLEAEEQHVIDLFSAILSTRLHAAYAHLLGCMRPSDTQNIHDCFVTAGHFTKRQRERERKLVVFDIGANHGYYSLLALGSAPEWLTVFSFEPQPECFQYVKLAMHASGFSQSSHVFNALAGNATSAAAAEGDDFTATLHHGHFPFVIPALSTQQEAIPLRTGCRGTFPAITKEEVGDVKRYFESTLGFDPTSQHASVGYIDPSRVLLPSPETVVLLAKIDVEGSEAEVLSALEPLLKAGRIANLVIEVNKAQKWRRLNANKEELPPLEQLDTDPAVVGWIMGLLRCLQGHGYIIVPSFTGFRNEGALPTDPGKLLAFARSAFLSVDLWAYLPSSKVRGLPTAGESDQ